jgi:hypothetical protein
MNMRSATGAYDLFWRQLYDLGYHPLPIIPGTKKPGVFTNGEWRGMIGWQDPNRRVIETPQPGAGVAVRTGKQRSGTYLIAIDLDDNDVAIAAMDLLPYAVAKIGARGTTIFLRSDKPIPSRNFFARGELKAQILSDRHATVIPPTIHPDTKCPYTWDTDNTLFNNSPARLPLAPDNLNELILQAIANAGHTPDPVEEPKEMPEGGYDEGSPFAELNALALRNLPKWIMDVGIPRCRRTTGPCNYEGVAGWRPSLKGRALEDRELNLRISGTKGIKDWGTNKGYSALDLVMAARSCSLSEAFDWLSERVKPQADIEVDFDKVIQETMEEPSINPEADDKADNADSSNDAGNADDEALAALTGGFWEHGDPLPEQIPMLIPYFVPLIGVGYVGGEWGTFKTFILNDMAVGVSSGGGFAGQNVLEPGCVMQVELEGSQNEVRLTGSSSSRGIQEKLPIRVFTHMPPKILGPNKRVTPEWKKWCQGMKVQADRMQAKFEMPVRLCTIDPVTTIAGWADENSAAEGQAVYEGLLYLSQLLKCVVVAADHYGKAPGSGLRGTVVKETAALFILGTSPRDKNVAARRFLEIRKMKNGMQNVAMDFFMDDHSFTAFRKIEKDGVETLEQMDVKTLAIRWDGELHPTDQKQDDEDEITPAQHKMLIAMKDLMRTKGVKCPEAPADEALASGVWEKKCLDDKICASRDVFRKQKVQLKDKRIGVSQSGDLVWFLLG